jgi:hypothetical protein
MMTERIVADHPDTPQEIRAQIMLNLHPPREDRLECQVMGACGAPFAACPLHQQGMTCLLEIEG